MRQWKAQDLRTLSSAYWASCTLHAAVRLDVFSPLFDGPLSVADLARVCQCDRRGLDLLVTALCGLDLIRRQGEDHGLCTTTDFSRQYLCRQSPDYLGHIICHQGDLVPAWAKLHEAVRTGQAQRDNSAHSSDEERASFIMGMYNVATLQAARSVPHIDLAGRRHLLDLGGGPATYAVRFCLHNAHLRATVFDLPTSEPFARQVIADHTLTRRVDFAGGDFMRDDLPKGCDVVWMSQILHGFSPAECALLVRRAVDAAEPGALIFIQEFTVDDDRNGPEFPGLFGLNMLVGTTDGQTYTAEDMGQMLRAAGAVDVTRLKLDLPDGCAILRAVKNSV